MNDKKYSLRPYLLAYKWHYAIGIFVLLAVDRNKNVRNVNAGFSEIGVFFIWVDL